MAIEVAFESPQTMVFNANVLALHLTRTVAALIDQHPQYFTAANLRQITGLARFADL